MQIQLNLKLDVLQRLICSLPVLKHEMLERLSTLYPNTPLDITVTCDSVLSITVDQSLEPHQPEFAIELYDVLQSFEAMLTSNDAAFNSTPLSIDVMDLPCADVQPVQITPTVSYSTVDGKGITKIDLDGVAPPSAKTSAPESK